MFISSPPKSAAISASISPSYIHLYELLWITTSVNKAMAIQSETYWHIILGLCSGCRFRINIPVAEMLIYFLVQVRVSGVCITAVLWGHELDSYGRVVPQ